MPCLFTREISNDSECSRSYGYGYDVKIMSTPTSHNFDIPGFAFHPSRFTLLSHVANLFLLKGNPYNLNLLLILAHPQAEQQGIKPLYAILLENAPNETDNGVHTSIDQSKIGTSLAKLYVSKALNNAIGYSIQI